MMTSSIFKSLSGKSGSQSAQTGAALEKNASDSLFIYLNWSAVIKSYVSHHSLLEKKRGLGVYQNILMIRDQAQALPKHQEAFVLLIRVT